MAGSQRYKLIGAFDGAIQVVNHEPAPGAVLFLIVRSTT